MQSGRAALANLDRGLRDIHGEIDRLDGLSAAFADWRFNLRQSNTEPVVRLNVDTRGDANLLRDKTEAISAVLRSFG